MFEERRDREVVYSAPEFWNRKARQYQGTAVSMFVNRHLNDYYQQEQFRFIDKSLDEVRGHEILDVGCGTGRLSRHLAQRGAKVTGIDFAADAVNVARNESQGLPIEFRVMSVFQLEDVERYDDITVLGCLTVACRNVSSFDEAVRRLQRALRPGGRMVIIEPFHTGRLSRVLSLDAEKANEIVKGAGFNITEQAELHFWPARIILSYMEWPWIVTAPICWLGEMLLSAAPTALHLGDYKAIGARRM